VLIGEWRVGIGEWRGREVEEEIYHRGTERNESEADRRIEATSERGRDTRKHRVTQ